MIKETRKEQLKTLLAGIGIQGKINYELVHRSLTHPSYLFEEGGKPEEHNQRLEFLGDAVVGLVVAQYLYKKYPNKTEGELTKMRAVIVCEASLAGCAQQLRLGEFLLMGKGEEQMGGAKRPSNLADCFEAFVGALYLNLGLEKIQPLVLNLLKNKISNAAKGKFQDYKTQLQEYIQRSPDNRLSYKILQEDGPDHEKQFLAAVYLNDKEMARGKGFSKKEAEQKAARLALRKLGV